MNGKIKLPILGILVALVAPCASAQRQATRTIIVFGASNQFIAVAADSKMVEPDTGEQKTECKITALGDKSIFTFTGMTFLQSVAHPELRWDAGAEARNAFKTVESSGTRGNPAFLSAVAEQWVQDAKNVFTQMTLTDASWFWRQISYPHMRAFFGGFDDAGKIGIIDVHIDLVRGQREFTDHIFSYSEDETIRFFAVGETQIAAEFILLKTPRARREYKRWQSTERGESAVEQASSRTIDLVQLSIKYLPPSAWVGPPIHAMILKRNGTVEWVPGKACH